MTRKRKDYTQEFKDSAVKLITEQGYKISEAARNLGINVSVLGRWKRESEAGNDSIASRSTQRKDNVQAELVRLRKENQRLRMEREILKNYRESALSPVRLETFSNSDIMNGTVERRGRLLFGELYTR